MAMASPTLKEEAGRPRPRCSNGGGAGKKVRGGGNGDGEGEAASEVCVAVLALGTSRRWWWRHPRDGEEKGVAATAGRRRGAAPRGLDWSGEEKGRESDLVAADWRTCKQTIQ